MIKNTLPIILICLFILSCKKDDPATDKLTLLTKKEWVVTAERTQKNSEPWKDVFITSETCDKDNRIIFQKNGKYDITEGTSKCSPTDPNYVEQGETWAFTQNETKITMTHNGGYEITIVQLDQNTFKLLHQYQQNGNSYKEETTLSHP